jgi:hypothetical protein
MGRNVCIAGIVILLLCLAAVIYFIVAFSIRIWPYSKNQDGFDRSPAIACTDPLEIQNFTCNSYTIKTKDAHVTHETSKNLGACVGKSPGISYIPLSGSVRLFDQNGKLVGSFTLTNGIMRELPIQNSVVFGVGGCGVKVLRIDGKRCGEQSGEFIC